MRLRFPATFDLKDYQRLNITKSDDLLILKYPEIYRDKIRVEMRKIVEKNAKNEANGKEPVELEIEMNIHYAKRSMSANAWLWSAHTLEAKLINTKDQTWRDSMGISWYKVGAVTPEEIHDHYMNEFAPRAKVLIEPDCLEYFRQALNETTGKVVGEHYIESIGKYELTLWKTSSYMNVAEFCALSEHVKESLISYGINLDDATDYTQLLTDLEGIKSRAVTDKEKSEDDASTVIDEPIVLKLRPDSVSIVESVFSGKREE